MLSKNFAHRPPHPEMTRSRFRQWIFFFWIGVEIEKSWEIESALIVGAALDLLKHHFPVPPLNAE